MTELLSLVLGADGHDVDTAANGHDALDKIQAHEGGYDVVLCDVRMPELDGPALYRELATRQPSLLGRFVFVTGSVHDSATARFLAETGAPVIWKPFSLDEVRRHVARVLGRC